MGWKKKLKKIGKVTVKYGLPMAGPILPQSYARIPEAIVKLATKKGHSRDEKAAEAYTELQEWIINLREQNLELREQVLALREESLGLQEENQKLRALIHQIDQLYDEKEAVRSILDKFLPTDEDDTGNK